LASVGKAIAFSCTVVSMTTCRKSAGLAAPIRVATARLSWISATSLSYNNNFAFGNGIIGVSNTGAPIRTTAFLGGNNRNDNEFFVARVGLNWKFGL
jgi:hypothetical protein